MLRRFLANSDERTSFLECMACIPTYLWVDGQRFHGKMTLLGEGRSYVKQTPLMPTGVYLSIEGLPKKAIRRLKSNIHSNAKRVTLSCITSACRILDESGVSLNKRALLPGGKLRSMLKHGLNYQGRPLRIRIYSSNEETLASIVNTFAMGQFIVPAGTALFYVVVGSAAVVASAVLYKMAAVALFEESE